jgi:hypothetical protein
MKVTVAAGHTPTGTAGCGAIGFLDESKCTREIAPLVEKYLQLGGATTNLQIINKGNSYNCEDCYTRAQNSNNWGADFYVEIHLNAGKGRGSEVEVSGFGGKAEEVARRVTSNISNTLDIPNRGVKEMNLIVLNKTKCPAILVECLFCDSSDADKYNADKIAKAIAEGILNKTITVPQPNTAQSVGSTIEPNGLIRYKSQIENIGWQGWVADEQVSGTEGKSLRLEALQVNCSVGNVSIQGHVQNIGWQAVKHNNEVIGTVGQSLRLEAVKMTLDNAQYSIQYQVHVQDIGWMPWAKDGEVAGTVGESKRIEAIKIKVVEKQ